MDGKTTNEISLKTVFTYIIDAIFLLFFITSGIITVKEGKIVIGILFFILSAMVLIPHHRLKVTQSLKFVILIILFVVLAGMSGHKSTPKEQKYEYFGLGEKFNLTFGNNTFSIVVREAKHDAKISVSGKEVTT